MFALIVLIGGRDAFAQLPDGLTRSRWAMDDPIYAEKYARGAEKTNIAGKIKQAADARFVRESYGFYGSAGMSSFGDGGNPMASAEAGVTGYWTSYFTNRIGAVAAANDDDVYLGVETGIRLQAPTRLAPFVGLGLFAGYAEETRLADNDGVDNDDNGWIDERGEEEDHFSGALAAVYPEIGVHFWWTPKVRLSVFARELVTTEGRDSDSTYFGGTIGIFSR
ncbi:hypothetical protein CA13_49390 [Planctomycetes bacterium CA13]|uniref:Outer membrane protein beta-barrel domain-containing protein n=2 Tax=Novipirellula herctigrandis TaxID=2527986 RepID=A0A5C5Z835_9BACT|nr:hypothetical protein CA13_49390 [Planctomycetes bacterium CA13]